MNQVQVTLSELTDELLVQDIKAGIISKEDGIEELITRYVPKLWRYCYSKYNQDDAIITDIVGETVMVIWETFDRFDPDRGHFSAWAYGIMRNKSKEYFRKEQKYQPFPTIRESDGNNTSIDVMFESDQAVAESFAYKEFQKRALETVLTLKEVDRNIFFLKSNYDLSYEELADILNNAAISKKQLTPDGIAKRYSRAKAYLRALLDEGV